jgi:hypothetical protein
MRWHRGWCCAIPAFGCPCLPGKAVSVPLSLRILHVLQQAGPIAPTAMLLQHVQDAQRRAREPSASQVVR